MNQKGEKRKEQYVHIGQSFRLPFLHRASLNVSAVLLLIIITNNS